MKMTTLPVLVGLFVLVAAQGVQATQKVIPATTSAGGTFAGGPDNFTVTRAAGQQLVFFGYYSDANANESGLGLKIAYDAGKFTGVTIDQVLTKCMVFTPDVLVNGANSQVLFGWADTSRRAGGVVGWPGTADDATLPCINPQGIVTQTGAFAPPQSLFRFTATLAAGFTSGTSAIAITSPSASSSSGTSSFTNTSLVVTGGAPGTIAFVSAASRKLHGATPFDIAIDPAGSMTAGTTVTVEPRSIGSGFQIVFLFDSAPTSATATTTSGTPAVSFAGNEAIVTLTGVADATRVQVGLSGVNGTASATAIVGFLLGDVNGSRLVNSTDILTVKSGSGAAASAGNFKSDLNASGLINSTDILTVKASSGHALP